jgi:enoyl-CoA hydratase
MSLVTVEIADRVATLTLNDPEGRNRLTLPMVTEISAAMDAIDADDNVGAVVVTGAGKAFCAGADLGDLGRSTGESLKVIYEGFLRIGKSPLPTLAAVNGPAVGAGMNLALICDVRVAAARARFDTRFPQLGIHPGGGHTWMLRRAVGQSYAAAMLLFGEIVDGKEAERIGLAHRCVADEDLLTTAHEMAKRAADVPRQLSVLIKQSLKDMAQITEHDSAVERELWPQVWTTRQPFFQERLAALQSQISSKG